MRALLLLASAMLASSAFAQTPGSCGVGTAQAFLDVSDVQASLFNTGALFFGGTTTSGDGYLVPKASGNSPIFAASLWIGGKVNGEVRASHSRYGIRQMWPGPLNEDGSLPNPDDCSAYDRIYTVSTYDVTIYEETGLPSSDLADWPVGLGAPAVGDNGEPVAVTSREQTLDLRAGERPVISGTQTAFWVMNDVGNVRRPGDGLPLGVEVAVTAFAVVSETAALHQGTYYRFKVTNRNTLPITAAYLGFYVDVDLGDAGDDYVGVDTTRGLAIGYNRSNADAAYGTPPAVGFDLLDGLGAFPLTGDWPWGFASTVTEVYNKLQGLWGDGTPITEFGYGYQTEGPVTQFGYAGDPVTESFWSEVNTDSNGTWSAGGDRQLELASPQFELAPGDSRTFALAVVFGQGLTHLTSITKLREASDIVQAAYDDGSLFATTAATPLLPTPELRDPEAGATLFDDPVTFRWLRTFGQRYRLDVSQSSDFVRENTFTTYSTVTYPEVGIPNWLVEQEPVALYWRVRAESNTQRSPWSAIRSFSYYRYIGQVLTLADGSPAYVEIAGPNGGDPCADGVTSPDGCDEVGGNLVYRSFNSTGEYYLSEQGQGSEATIGSHAPNDFEIRFTDTGSLGYFRFQGYDVIRVPFEIWDIGVVAPGDTNDPADDVQLIPVFFADNGGTCDFQYGEIEQEATLGHPATDRIYAYYPSTSYADFEAAYADSVATAEGNCFTPQTSLNTFTAGIRPIQRQVFADVAGNGTLPGSGTTIRLYTVDPFIVADEDRPRSGDLTLGPAYPNPTASALTVPYRLAQASEIELAVYDVLGRRVLEWATTRQPEGAHAAVLDASALAPGVYVIRLRAGEATRTTRITVVR